jgi:UDP-N-acetyl-D-mannosaminouronate:lipid I N-acetyl-D-mannosaminouronosyltransferase
MKITPVKVRNVNVYPFQNIGELMDYTADKKKLLLSLNAEIIMRAEGKIADIINSNIGYADGYGAVKAMYHKGEKTLKRIPGCELWLELIKRYHSAKTFYLIGSTEDTICATVKKLKELYPDINIVGYRNGFIKQVSDKDALLSDVKEKKPDFVFVAMGFPIQELLMNELYQIHAATYLNLGGSFDVFTGKVSRAPKWIQNIGMEWFYRFITHPSRYKRQVVYLQFLCAYCGNRL